jgi:subtilisin
MKYSGMNGANSFFYSLIFFIGIAFSSCHEKDKLNEPEPIAQPQPEPENPDDCITKPAADNGSAIAGHYVVQYKVGEMEINSETTLPTAIAKVKSRDYPAKKIFTGKFHACCAHLTSSQLEELKKDPSVESIEPDRIVSIATCYTTVNDQSIPWGIKRVGSGNGTGKTIWIIDTGVDLDHPDLNVDVSRCISFIDETTPEDDHGHGSHVAGTIAAKNNYIGVVGVAANASIVALKVMDKSGRGTTSNVIAAVNYVSKNAKAGDVVNMSLGGEVSDVMDKAVKEAAEKGILFAIAAGNSSVQANLSSPGRVNHSNVFTVSAMNDQGSWASFSNYGNDVVDYCAPGVNITSTHKEGGYATMSGTSMATPHVAGLLLLNGKNILTDGFVKNDPDSLADPIAHK